jgi:hypothetical protein
LKFHANFVLLPCCSVDTFGLDLKLAKSTIGETLSASDILGELADFSI